MGWPLRESKVISAQLKKNKFIIKKEKVEHILMQN